MEFDAMDMGVKDAAAFLNVTEKTIYRWLADNMLPAARVGKQYRFSRADLSSWAASRGRYCEDTEAAPPSDLGSLLRRGGIFYRIEGTTVEEAIRHMVELLRMEPTTAESLVALVLAREAMGTTAIGSGIAVPHPRDPIPHMRQPLLALGFLETPIDFGALDQKPVGAIFLTASPTATGHLSLLSRFSYTVRQPQVLKLIHDQATRGAIISAIERVEVGFPEEL